MVALVAAGTAIDCTALSLFPLSTRSVIIFENRSFPALIVVKEVTSKIDASVKAFRKITFMVDVLIDYLDKPWLTLAWEIRKYTISSAQGKHIHNMRNYGVYQIKDACKYR
mmetsp:Transcript_10665/g.15399  ORF Transcript_10665/g.15399 Transcript_10665/m.15399 type:complete len:111 (-) Transcript_10665:93-425(-)